MRKFVVFFILYSYILGCLGDANVPIPPVIVPKPVSYSQTNASKTIITREDMAAVGVTSLAQALQTMGALQLQDTSGNGSQLLISMRGFGANASSNTLLLVNGMPITNPDLAPPNLNDIPFQDIQYVEIISGSESVLYGDQAVGGVVNVVTRDQTQKDITGSCSAGSYHTRNCSAGLNDTYGPLSYGIGALNQHTDNYRDHNDYDQNLLSGRFGYGYSTGSLHLDYTFANERILYPGALTGEQVSENRRQSTNETDFFADSNASLHFKQDQTFHTNWHFITDLERRQMYGNGVLSSPFRQSRVIDFIKPQWKGEVGGVLLNTGMDYEHDTYDLNTTFGITDDTAQKYGIFSMATVPTPLPRLTWLVGARGAKQNNQLHEADTIDTINRALATTLGVTFQVNPATTFYLRRAGSFRFPKADENASTPPGVNGLKTQRGVAYETGVDGKWQQLTCQFAIYQLNLTDEIAFDPQQTPDRPFGTNTNYPPTIRQGFTVSEKYAFMNQVTVDGQYHFVRARFQNGIYAGDQIPLVSENIVRGGVRYAFAPHWSVYSEAIYTGNQYPANDNANVGGKIGGYTTYNLNWRFVYQHLTASFRVNNILNKYYYLYTTFEPSVDEQFFYPAPGRNVLLTVRYSLV